ncbi:hypothetical protein VPH35_048725 [Triticum aestivum]
MLREILLRLPLDLYSLPRASAVCKQWRGILADPKFLRRFYAHHRKPPLLGFFHYGSTQIAFMPVLAPAPDRITPGRFSLGHYSKCILLDSRHGRALVLDLQHEEVVVCDPITNKHHRVPIPPEFTECFFNAAVLCAASYQGHVHGGCHLCPFKVVLVSYRDNTHPYASVYSSETTTWGNVISTEASDDTVFGACRSTLVDNVLYWPAKEKGDDIVEFDLGTQNLSVIKGPQANDLNNASRKIMQADNGDVGLAILSYPYFQMWQRDLNYHGVMRWVLQKTIDISIILGLPPLIEARLEEWKTIEGYTEDAIFLCVGGSLYMVQLDSMKSKRLQESDNFFCCRPFTSFYAPGDCSFSHVSYMVAEMSLFFFLCHDNKSLVTSVPQHNCQMSENIKSNVNE